MTGIIMQGDVQYNDNILEFILHYSTDFQNWSKHTDVSSIDFIHCVFVSNNDIVESPLTM